MKKKMTASELKHNVELTGSYFFTRNTMKFFGDTMANYGVRSKPVIIENSVGDMVECWELYRKHAAKYGVRSSAFFDVKTFERVWPKKD